MLVYWSVFQEIPQIIGCQPDSIRQESGDGNRLVQLILETLSAVLEGSFDEGWVKSVSLGWLEFHFKKVGKREI